MASDIVGESQAMRMVRERARLLARGDIPVLLLGETGTGKDVLARYIHQCSPRAGQPLVELNLATLPENLLPSELFGHERGAFTGAVAARAGLVVEAGEGTLFLNDVGHLGLAGQAVLLQVLDAGRYRRLGGGGERVGRARVVCASSRLPAELVAEQKMLPDLMFRLGAPLYLPPLRERREDIGLLVRAMVAHERENSPPEEWAWFGEAEEARLARLLQEADYPWPGNVRELETLVRRLWLEVVRAGPGADLEEGVRRCLAEARAAYGQAVPEESLADLVCRRLCRGQGPSVRELVEEWARLEVAAGLVRALQMGYAPASLAQLGRDLGIAALVHASRRRVPGSVVVAAVASLEDCPHYPPALRELLARLRGQQDGEPG
ncbi:MAG: sigma 54-interacting transcriptional regulator [Syntrophomonadaceae bacterium]|nr:sigma 54-interacting transcriptional regulator [Syntrophomonadaceae bacterium]